MVSGVKAYPELVMVDVVHIPLTRAEKITIRVIGIRFFMLKKINY